MTKTFCDRCGKEITNEYGWLTRSTLYASIKLIPGKNHPEWSKREDQYICPECENSYIQWFMNPVREKKMDKKSTYSSPVGDWLCGKRR